MNRILLPHAMLCYDNQSVKGKQESNEEGVREKRAGVRESSIGIMEVRQGKGDYHHHHHHKPFFVQW